MIKKSCESFLCFFLIFIINFGAISVSAKLESCDAPNGNFKPNSTYDKNRRLILSSLASNVSAHNGYFNGSTGIHPDRVYAMGMCAPGAKPDVCSSCIKNTSDTLLHDCQNQTGGFAWLGDEILCLVRYSSKSFSGLLGLDPSVVMYNITDIGKENRKEFDNVWNGLMSRTITKASSSSSTNSSLSGKYYAKDVAPVPVYGNIWVLMQCTPDIFPMDCHFCLEKSLDYYTKLFDGMRGVIIMKPSCFFRWQVYSFSGAIDGFTDENSPLHSVTKKKDRGRREGIIAVIIVVSVVTIILISVGLVICKRRKQKEEIELPTESVQFNLKTIEAATNNFCNSNLLGKGGFGEVFKGMLMDGTEIAVKRLSKTSGQGEVEFKNEVVVVARLQHINLVRLLGFSLQGEEKLLVYEFVPNKSLDYFLFDSMLKNELDWTVRRKIIDGITRGILYLHRDSRLKIIHRDLKAGNILLDANMNPKIADFGMARIFGVEQTVANTARVVGTFGYMSPEYMSHGEFSMKSDVYSFGVLILEIISAKKNSSFYQMDGLVNNLVSYVWRLWENKSLVELVDPGIREDCKIDEVIRYIHIGLLCVQENPTDRPTMATIYQMLTTSSMILPEPLQPGFFLRNGSGSNPLGLGSEPSQSSSKSFTCSVDEATITIATPR